MKNIMSRKIFLFTLLLVVLTTALFGQESENLPLPTSEPTENEIRFAAIGDSGTGGKDQYKVAEQLLKTQIKTKFNLLLFLGDNIYESGSPKGIEKKFIKPYAPLFQRGVEFRGVIGNHDAKNENGVILQQMIFNMGKYTFYSFVKGNGLVEFFAMDSTLMVNDKDQKANQLQLDWFENVLSESKSRWKIAFMHHSLYSSAQKHGLESSDQDEMLQIRNMLEPLYKKYDVRISINGHDHIYERTKPQHGVQYFTSGVGAKLRKGNLQKDSPFYGFGNDQVRGFMLFSVTSDSLKFWAIDIDGNVLDQGIIG
jgi:predicted phosphodiesterase